MVNSCTVVGYSYKADTYCPLHVVEEVAKDYDVDLEEVVRVTEFGSGYPGQLEEDQMLEEIAEIYTKIDYSDPHSYDTDNFPKVIFADSAAENEDACCICHERLV